MNYLENYYANYDEEGRLASKHGQVEGKEYAAPNSEGNGNGSLAIYDIDGDGYEELPGTA